MRSDSIRMALWIGFWLAVPRAGAAAQVPAFALAPADSSVEAPPVDRLVAQALASAPSIAARRARASGSHWRSRGAGALPDPMVEVSLEDVSFPRWTVGKDEMSTLGVELRQEFGGFGRRRAERDALAEEAQVLDTETMDAARRATLAVRTQ